MQDPNTKPKREVTPLDPEYEIVSPDDDEQMPEGVVREIKKEHLDLTTKLKELRVTNEEAYKIADEMCARAKARIASIEEFKKAITGPFKTQIKNIEQMFDRRSLSFKMIKNRCEELMVRYADSRKSLGNLRTMHTKQGTSMIKDAWDYEITDPAKVPRKYLTIDYEKIGREVRAGSIPEGQHKGFKVFKTKQIAHKKR